MSFVKVSDKDWIDVRDVRKVRGVDKGANSIHPYYISMVSHTPNTLLETYGFETEEEAQRVLDEIVGAK